MRKASRGAWRPLPLLCMALGALSIAMGFGFLVLPMARGDALELKEVLFDDLLSLLLLSGGAALVTVARTMVRAGSRQEAPAPSSHVMAGPEALARVQAQAQDAAVSGPTAQPGVAPASPAREGEGDAAAVSSPATPSPHGESAPDLREVPAEPARTHRPSGHEELTELILRSSDIVASLKDLVRHEASQQGAHRHLAQMLEAMGLMAWDDAPACEAGLLGRNHHFWLRYPTDELAEEDYDRLVSLEAALNVSLDLDPTCDTLSMEEARPAVAQLFRGLTRQRIPSYDFVPSLGVAYPGVPYEETPGEWYVRTSFASAAECAVTPFRVVHDHRVSVEQGVLVASVELVRARCMAIFTTDPEEQAALMRDYALRLGALLAERALGCSRRLSVAIINFQERGDDRHTVRLSARFTREDLAQVVPQLEGGGLGMGAIPETSCLRYELNEHGLFRPIMAFLMLDDVLVCPKERFTYPELDHRATSARLREVTGARHVDELGINENAGRLAARDALEGVSASWQTTQDAIPVLVQMRNEAQDITVSEACNRVIEALLAGTVDCTDREAIAHLLLGSTALDAAVDRADDLLDDRETTADPIAAVRVLTEALSPIQAVGAYLDDTDTIYRYFGSVAERICFELKVNDHARRVQLVPDAYFNALAHLSSAYEALGEEDKALQAADEMMRIAPTSIGAAMRKVRVLERASRVFEAKELIREVLRYACTPRDAAICHYRLAFMEWKLGREDLAVACYERSLTWSTDLSFQAQEELDDLLADNERLRHLAPEETCALLTSEGIPLGFDEEDQRRTLAAAALSCDEGIFWVARPLVGVLLGASGDDVLMGIYRSLEPLKPSA